MWVAEPKVDNKGKSKCVERKKEKLFNEVIWNPLSLAKLNPLYIHLFLGVLLNVFDVVWIIFSVCVCVCVFHF